MTSEEGAGILRLRQRERMGWMRRCRLVASRIILQLFIYFSMVLRRAPWASRVSLSASLIISTLKGRCLDSMLAMPAIYLTTCWTICLSWCRLSAGVISMWWLVEKMLNSMVVEVPSGFKILYSSFSLKTWSPKILARKA